MVCEAFKNRHIFATLARVLENDARSPDFSLKQPPLATFPL
jgi:hypothetical protein